jgi:hypothetical protein
VASKEVEMMEPKATLPIILIVADVARFAILSGKLKNYHLLFTLGHKKNKAAMGRCLSSMESSLRCLYY